jgi:thymidylate synthase (FAD)
MRTELLDHGYVELIETWGSDERIIEAARMSTNKGFLGWGTRHEPACPATQPAHPGSAFGGHCCCEPKPGDEKLLRYLYTNNHATPFEMAGMIVEVKAPLMVFREWHRHRTQSYNEMSARYVPIPDENYMPTLERLFLGNEANKQASRAAGAAVLREPDALVWLAQLADVYEHTERVYQRGLAIGIPKEIARLSMTVGRYSRMRAQANLRNWLGFLTLRMAPNAQWEIRQYANAVGEMVAQKFPRTWELFVEGRTTET